MLFWVGEIPTLFIFMEENVFDSGTIGKVLRENMGNNVFDEWLVPGRKDARKMVEQLAMDQIEPSVKMQGLIDAGINPLTAAAGIAGSGGSSPLPASEQSTNPIGDVANAVGSVAGAAQNIVGAVSGAAKLPAELRNIDADTTQKLAGAGLSNAQTQGVLTDNSYKDEDWKTRLNVQRQQFENMKQELTNLKATHREIMTHCEEMISQIELNGSAKEYNEALMSKVQEETRWMKELNDWRISHNLHIVDSGIDGYIFDMALRGADISEFDNFIDIYSEWRGRVQRAVSDSQYSSEAEYAYQISNARKNGENVSDVLYGRIGSWSDAIGRAANVIGGHIDNVVSGMSAKIKGLTGSAKGKAIREELTMVLNNAYDQLDKFPQDKDRITGVIADIQAALQLSNRELIEWYEKTNH